MRVHDVRGFLFLSSFLGSRGVHKGNKYLSNDNKLVQMKVWDWLENL